MQCPACLQTPPDGARFCPACGGEIGGGAARSPDALEGQIVGGRYVIRDLIAEGGMGRVYLAEQQMGTSVRRVAVKVMLADYANNPKVVTRFLRECGMVSELEHPNTIKFYDYGKTDDGDLFIAMEFVPGEPLSAAIKRQGPLAPERVDRILSQICGALQEAHDKGIVHRDIKPENVLLTQPAGEPDVVKVLDFGIARRDGDRDPRLTPLGLVLGSPPYMSPEQFLGGDVDHRSDIYSLGIVTYRALTGVLPFKAHELYEWATLHMSAAPIPFDALATGPAIPANMKAAVLRALAKSPADRPQSMRELYQELTIGAGSRTSLLGRSQPPPAFSSTPPPPAPPSEQTSPTRAGEPPGSSESLAPTLLKGASHHPPTWIDEPREPDAPSAMPRAPIPPPEVREPIPRHDRPPPTVREPVPPTVRQREKSNALPIVAAVVLIAAAIFGGVILAKRVVDGAPAASVTPARNAPPPIAPPPPVPTPAPAPAPSSPFLVPGGAPTAAPVDDSCRQTIRAASAGQCPLALGLRVKCPATDPSHAAAHAAYDRHCADSGAP